MRPVELLIVVLAVLGAVPTAFAFVSFIRWAFDRRLPPLPPGSRSSEPYHALGASPGFRICPLCYGMSAPEPHCPKCHGEGEVPK